MPQQCGAWCNRFAWLGCSVETAKCMPSASNGMVCLYDTCHYCTYQITHSSNVMYTTPPPSPNPVLLPAPIHSPPTVSIPSGCIALLLPQWHLHTATAARPTRLANPQDITRTPIEQTDTLAADSNSHTCSSVQRVMSRRREHENF